MNETQLSILEQTFLDTFECRLSNLGVGFNAQRMQMVFTLISFPGVLWRTFFAAITRFSLGGGSKPANRNYRASGKILRNFWLVWTLHFPNCSHRSAYGVTYIQLPRFQESRTATLRGALERHLNRDRRAKIRLELGIDFSHNCRILSMPKQLYPCHLLQRPSQRR